MSWTVELRGGRAKGKTMRCEYLGPEILHGVVPKIKWFRIRDWEPLTLRNDAFEEHYEVRTANPKTHTAIAYYTGLSRSRALYQCRNVRTRP